jgi:hypothetical protein
MINIKNIKTTYTSHEVSSNEHVVINKNQYPCVWSTAHNRILVGLKFYDSSLLRLHPRQYI